jgi:GT2 family glycosyltransferase
VPDARLAVVVIGRNEGERLLRCLDSLAGCAAVLVYVDSGSSDGSVAAARARGALVHELDMSRPFTAARARNAGFACAKAACGPLQWVQFVDGDCVVADGWIAQARDYLDSHPQVAGAFGRRRERAPDASIYNRLCDIEWAVPPGEARYCGGDVMFRADAVAAAGGYRDDLIAGEEPELCVRLRRAGWTLQCLPHEMTLHDAAMTRLSQWWRRTVRSGYAYAQGAYLHGAAPERHWVKPLASALAWTAGPPLLVLITAPALGAKALAFLLLYPLQAARLAFAAEGALRVRIARGVFLVLGKLAEAQGALRFARDLLLGRTARLIEYK